MPPVFIFPLNTLPIIIPVEVKRIPGMAKERKSQTVRRLIASQRNSRQITITMPLYINSPLNIFCILFTDNSLILFFCHSECSRRIYSKLSLQGHRPWQSQFATRWQQNRRGRDYPLGRWFVSTAHIAKPFSQNFVSQNFMDNSSHKCLLSRPSFCCYKTTDRKVHSKNISFNLRRPVVDL